MKKLTMFQKIVHGLPEGAAQMIISIVGFYSMIFYSDILGINPAIVGTIFLVSRVISCITDPAVGAFVDSRKPLKGGKYIPYVTIGSVIMGIALTLIFLAPNLPMTAKIVYVILTYNLYNVSYSIFDVPYGSVLSTLTTDYDEVNQIGIVRSFIGGVGMTLIGYIADGLLNAFGFKTGVINNYTITAAVFGIFLIATAVLMSRTVHEQIAPAEEEGEEKRGIREIFKIALTNRPLLIIVCVNLLSNTAWLLRDASILYYFQYVLNRTDLFALFIAIGGLTQFPLLLILPKLSQKFGNKNVIVATTLLSLAAFAVEGIWHTNIAAVMIAGALANAGWGTFYGLMFGMVANTIEYGEWKNGIRTAGVSYSLPLIAFKIAMGLNSFILGLLLEAGHYIPGGVQPQSALTAITSAFIYIPGALAVLWLLIILGYKLDKQYPQIIAELEARKRTAGSMGSGK